MIVGIRPSVHVTPVESENRKREAETLASGSSKKLGWKPYITLPHSCLGPQWGTYTT